MSDLDYLFLIVRNFKGNPTTIKIPFSLKIQAEANYQTKIKFSLVTTFQESKVSMSSAIRVPLEVRPTTFDQSVHT